ncbi:MAG TPA: YggT family protein [Anaerolineae bacterium]|nr:YggT family protein [Anaerolineae bacterium]
MPFSIRGVIDTVFWLLQIFILVRIILTWIPTPMNGITKPILNFIYDVTEPILRPFRNVIPPIMIGGMGWDLSPILALILLRIINSVVQQVLWRIGIA